MALCIVCACFAGQAPAAKNLNKSKLPHAIVEFADEAQATEVLSSVLNEEASWKSKNALRMFPLLKNKEKGSKSKESKPKVEGGGGRGVIERVRAMS